MDFDGGNKRVYNRLGGPSGAAAANDAGKHQKVCNFWRSGKCNRFPCPYLHRELPGPGPAAANGSGAPKRFANDRGFSGPAPRRGPNFNSHNTWGRAGANKAVQKMEKVCNYWVQGNCGYGDKCKFLHSWKMGEGFSLLTQLEGHQKVVTGIALPSGSDKLYSGSKDDTVRVWDCASGQYTDALTVKAAVNESTAALNVGGEVGCIITEGPWLFVGVPNFVKAWNIQTNADMSLSGPVGQVYALVIGSDMLFAGTQEGPILAWKFNVATNCFEPAASLTGHTLAVVSLVVGGNRLYSGSMDNSIKVWSLENLQCIQTLTEHTSVVMSLLCWEQFLLSCSLDKTIKVWVASESGNLEVTYTHNEDHGLLTLCGTPDFEGKPVLLSACNDNSLRLYDLPSFNERGKIFSKQEIRAIEIGPGGLFFTGDGTGQVRVWQWSAEPAAATTS